MTRLRLWFSKSTRFLNNNTLDEFFVVFKRPDNLITKFFLGSKFGHITIYKKIPEGYLKIDSLYTVFNVEFVSPDEIAEVINKEKEVNIVLSVVMAQTRSNNNVINWVFMHIPRRFDCVSMALYVLGIHSFTGTPYGVYKKLIMKKTKNIISVEELR